MTPSTLPSHSDRISTFRELHRSGTFLMPNPWDVGSALYLQSRGFPALATTSSGFAATLGRADQTVFRDELIAHVRSLTAAISIPLSVDTENCLADDLAGIATTVRLVAEAGASGCSIEDFDPAKGQIYEFNHALERVAAAAAEAKMYGIVLTARAENYLHDHQDFDDTISRLSAFAKAGADVVYAPGLVDETEIAGVVTEVDAPVNLLALPNAPSVATLTELGVRRISTGGSLAWAALAGLAAATNRILEAGVYDFQTAPFEAKPVPRGVRAELFS